MATRDTHRREDDRALSRAHALVVAGVALLAPVVLLGAAYMLVLR
jgi:hypothetical protein